jgi:hypothetical protein
MDAMTHYKRLAERFEAYDDMTYPDDSALPALVAKLMRVAKDSAGIEMCWLTPVSRGHRPPTRSRAPPFEQFHLFEAVDAASDRTK